MTLDVDKMIRNWGEWEVLYSLGTTKVKKVTINVGCELSFQRHLFRNELWYIHQGHGSVIINNENVPDPKNNESYLLKSREYFLVPAGVWHQLANVGKEPLVIIELQYGDKCSEDDIERI